jgi:hypothetical protein
MTNSRKAAIVADTKLSAGGAFALNACFVAGLLVLSQLSLLQQRATMRTSIVVAALLLLAWSVVAAARRWSSSASAGYQFLLRGDKGPFADREPARLHARVCEQGWPRTCVNQ